ncbi:recombination-associated protein RdgC [Francisella philomiragia]|uniref:recombination-associated protein RdgC n=1 Tax=Francisella philomiragia TaxID=28110 RepID=UPI001903D1AB|nr:recombination-associated protein RdgC [Francisella philomiragia]MBK2267388.1 recombination-associated protein RdgC [Francisella philomiragia]MBK2278844.1 recombination-associated protein RdgC [Francisella philomiragia]MBK2286916.1 recombination-associated protein RdgC [Francisella philomiragia]MBK2288676.1 recombination-associated protein RdgC [Francisella philomiragia]MBK2290394.1 recombination-associated protein RdgC [Francisella philomiragia]
MFFKNLTAFKITDINIDIFEDSMNKLAFIPCSNSQKSSRGFTNPFIKDEQCLFKFNHLAAFCLLTEEKILPAQVINQQAQEYIQELELTRYVSKKEKTQIKEDMEQKLLPLAFSKFRKVHGYLDLTNNYLIIDSVSEKQIIEVLDLLHRCEARFEPVIKEETDILTEWLVEDTYPVDIEIAEKCKLTSAIGDSIANISCQGSSMLNDNIKSFIDSGGYITELAITWKEQLAMTANTKLQFKSIKFLDGIKDLNKEDNVGHEVDLLLMADIFAELITAMQSWIKEDESL